MANAGSTRFLIITHHRMTMARMHRLFGVTMTERGVSQLVSVDLQKAEALVDCYAERCTLPPTKDFHRRIQQELHRWLHSDDPPTDEERRGLEVGVRRDLEEEAHLRVTASNGE